MTQQIKQQKREWRLAIIIALFGVSILIYQFLDFDKIGLFEKYSAQNKERIQKKKTEGTLIIECDIGTSLNLDNNKKIDLTKVSQSTSSINGFYLIEIEEDVFINNTGNDCKSNLYWSKGLFLSSWRKMIKPCLGNMKFRRKVNRYNATNIRRSNIVLKRNTEQTVLHIKIYSKNQDDKYKTIGGDSWKTAIFKDDIFLTVDMLDNNDGTYETSISVPVDGIYKINITILHSLCEDFMDPPEDFFAKGNNFLL